MDEIRDSYCQIMFDTTHFVYQIRESRAKEMNYKLFESKVIKKIYKFLLAFFSHSAHLLRLIVSIRAVIISITLPALVDTLVGVLASNLVLLASVHLIIQRNGTILVKYLCVNKNMYLFNTKIEINHSYYSRVLAKINLFT